MPLLSAYVLIEIGALCTARWRALRVGGPRARLRLGLPVVLATLGLAAAQGWFIVAWLGGLGLIRGDIPVPMLTTLLSLMGGVLVLVLVARFAGRFGLANGFSLVLVSSVVVQVRAMQARVDATATSAATVLAGALAVTALIILTGWAVRRRRGLDGWPALPAPSSGAVPIMVAFWVISAASLLASLVQLNPAWLEPLLPGATMMLLIHLVVTLALGASLAVAFSGPHRWSEPAGRLLGRPIDSATAWRLWWRATAVSGVFLVLAAAIYFAIRTHLGVLAFELPALLVGTAVALDVRAEWQARARQPSLVSVWPLHQVALAPHVRQALVERGIPVHLRGLRHRSLLHIFGPFVPIEVMVAPEQAQESLELLGSALAPR